MQIVRKNHKSHLEIESAPATDVAGELKCPPVYKVEMSARCALALPISPDLSG